MWPHILREITWPLSTIPSQLKKKCNAIAYHAIPKSMVIGESLEGHVRLEDNPADLLTIMITQQKKKYIASLVLHNIYDVDT